MTPPTDRLVEIKRTYAECRETLWITRGEGKHVNADQHVQWLIAEIERLRWLIDWIDENASFRQNEWPEWERRRDHPEPWLLDET